MKKNHIIIMTLIGIIFIMSLAFAAFSSLLTINGNASIDNSWNVEITNIVSKNKIGNASNNGEPVYTKTSATFKTVLISPGDSMTYDVTIKNKGTVDAKLKKITLTNSNNPAIIFETSGIKENDVLKVNEEQIFTVKVKYNDEITSQPEVLNASLTVKLDYIQNS
ncbi:MAG: hypothetical protein IKE90_03965 [Bacilli bacterium]|nr:hypothetical protein [Bacilli bacterium]